MGRRLGAAVAAMLLASQLGVSQGAADPSVDQLSQIANYLSENDVDGLRAYLVQSPELLAGEGSIAGLLRDFMAESEDSTAFFAFEPDLRNAVSGSARSSNGGGGGSSGGDGSSTSAGTSSAQY